MTDAKHAAWRLTAMECDSEERRAYLLAAADEAESAGKFVVDVLLEVLATCDGLVQGHEHTERVRSVLQMRGELARVIEAAG